MNASVLLVPDPLHVRAGDLGGRPHRRSLTPDIR